MKLLSLFLSIFLVLACAPTRPGRSVEPSGFLGDYSQLREGGPDEALLLYIDSDADFSRYAKVAVDPVTVWRGSGSDMADVPEDELQVLVDYLDASVRHSLARDYELVERPGADALRLRIALTEAEGSAVVLDTVSAVIPQLRLLSGAKSLATGTHAFVGSAGVEAELLDGLTGERIAAAVDRRVGAKTLSGSIGTWDDVQQSFDYWSERLRERLAELRATPVP